MKVGLTIKRWRLERGYTQKELSDLSGVKDVKMIGKYENDKAFPCVNSTLPALCKALKIELEIHSRELPKNYKPKQ